MMARSRSGTATSGTERMSEAEVEALKRSHPLAAVVASYGLRLRREGARLVSLCPFHAEHTPSLYLFPDQRFHCFGAGCEANGDVLDFIQKMEGIGFRQAIERLRGAPGLVRLPSWQMVPAQAQQKYERLRQSPLGQAVLRAAQRIYTQALQESPEAQDYLAARGLTLNLADRCGLGFCRGDQLAHELRRRGISLAAAREIGVLVGPEHRERFAGRMTIPELRKGHPIWMTGRCIKAPTEGEPRYMSLPGPRPLFGKRAIEDTRTIIICEGAFDWLTLTQWELPAIAVLGGALSPSARAELGAALSETTQIFLAFDQDGPGQGAASKFVQELGRPAHRIELPSGVKDVNELGQQPAGRGCFLAGMRLAAVGQGEGNANPP